ncbi:MAG: hypothetical protein EOO46_21340, partial [Flavobacterium sp.]
MRFYVFQFANRCQHVNPITDKRNHFPRPTESSPKAGQTPKSTGRQGLRFAKRRTVSRKSKQAKAKSSSARGKNKRARAKNKRAKPKNNHAGAENKRTRPKSKHEIAKTRFAKPKSKRVRPKNN